MVNGQIDFEMLFNQDFLGSGVSLAPFSPQLDCSSGAVSWFTGEFQLGTNTALLGVTIWRQPGCARPSDLPES